MKKLITTGILFLTLVLALSSTMVLAGDAAIISFSPSIFARHNSLVDTDYIFMDLDKHDLTMTKGQTVTLKAFINPSGKSIKVDWRSSNSQIAKVSNDGKVTAVAPGIAMIRVFSDNHDTYYDLYGYSDECYVTVKGGSKDAQPLGTSDRTYTYGKTKFQAPIKDYAAALTLVKKNIGGDTYSTVDDKDYYYGLMYGAKDLSKAHTAIYIVAYEDEYLYGYGFNARGKSPIKTSRGITIDTKKSEVQKKYGLPTFADQYTDEGKAYEILSYHSKTAGKNLYLNITFHILKSKDTVSMIQFYCGG